jgi:acyl-coenzyme A thioesterase PaaI-like protein
VPSVDEARIRQSFGRQRHLGTINLLEPAQGTGFVARGRVLRPGRTLSVCRADVVTADPSERLIATMTSTIIIRPLRRA